MANDEGRHIALILTVLNERGSIEHLLESIANQTRLPDELVVTDAGSTDGTMEALREWNPPGAVSLRLMVRPGVSISEGRNLAISAATCEIIAVTDAGTSFGPRWLEDITRSLVDRKADVVGGFFEPGGSRPFQRFLGAVTTPVLSEIEPEQFLPSSRSIAFTQQAWASVGGYPEWLDYCEDLVFDLDLKANGAVFAFAPSAIVAWDARPGWIAFFRQYYRYARGDGKASLWPKRHLVRYASYCCGAVLFVAAQRHPIWYGVLSVGGMAYMSRYVRRLAARWEDLDSEVRRLAPALPLVMVTGDIAKMAGYGVGIAWRRRRRGSI
mgnify:CR=1 FL=1|jgi:glycosyltransferase involved in cell wall biosynthesis